MSHSANLEVLLSFAIGFILAPMSVLAEPVPPPFSLSGATSIQTLRAPPPSTIRLGRTKLTLERMPLAQLRRLAGAGEIAHRGDASESTYWLCYTIQTPATSQRIWFLAGELNGPEHFVSGVQATSLQAAEGAKEGCPLLPPHLQPIALDSGLWLGKAKSEWLETLGKPSSSEPDSLSFEYAGKVPSQYEGKKIPLDRINYLHLVLKDDRVQGLIAWQTTTY